jgi:hypothetical protein
MGILKSAADLVYTIRFLKLLVTPFEDTPAFKAGIIDKEGKKRKDFNTDKMDDRENYRDHYTAFHRLVYNLKKIMAKAPGGQSVVARYGAALALIKEHGELSDKQVEKIHAETDIDVMDFLLESQSKWYLVENGNLGPGVYRMQNDTLTDQAEDIVRKDDQIRVTDHNHIDDILGIAIYEGVHVKTGRRVLFSANEVRK